MGIIWQCDVSVKFQEGWVYNAAIKKTELHVVSHLANK